MAHVQTLFASIRGDVDCTTRPAYAFNTVNSGMALGKLPYTSEGWTFAALVIDAAQAGERLGKELKLSVWDRMLSEAQEHTELRAQQPPGLPPSS
jgi:hypothetical protein